MDGFGGAEGFSTAGANIDPNQIFQMFFGGGGPGGFGDDDMFASFGGAGGHSHGGARGP